MLKLSLRPGEYLMIGENVKVIFTGGTGNNLRIMVDAPKEISVVRNKAAEKAGTVEPIKYYKEPAISDSAQQEIRRIISEERMKLSSQ